MDNRFAVVPGKDPDGWSFTLEPYLWAMAVSGKVGVNGLPPAKIDYSPKTVLQHLDWGIMAKGEVRKGRWGLLADGIFAQLSAGADLPAPFYDSSGVKLQQGMASLALAYRVIDDRRGFLDLYAGARYNYAGINVTSSPDSAGIASFGEGAAGRIVQGAGAQADAFLAQNADALAAQVKDAITTKALEKLADFPDGVNPREIVGILNGLRKASPEYRELIAAVAEARVATAKNKLTTAIQNRVSQAEKKLAKAISRAVEDRLPTSYDGSQWWVDPIVGFRAQVNFTRWLYLSAQGDVGGFGAGSTIAWNVEAGLGVNFTRNIFAEVGYRYFYMDYTNGGALYQAGEYGLFLGLGTRF
jgi:opacity protein-like surface antigen